ncbi:MAG: helix-turn-helix transcriptional regulator [Oscillospiraceae bacterium]|nr:helix-turn-helix transcriptional regulator [Oscillospiraceae bacterium]MDY6208008.1 helix-turn-helix transcriptional regulator [Oscillospiraceae bacterium]
MNTILKNKINTFLKHSKMSQAQFAKCADIGVVTLNLWLNDKRVISSKMEKRMEDFMLDYAAKITEIANS